MLFSMVNLARFLKIDPESALRATNAKFRRRFAGMERAAGESGLAGRDIDALEELWRAAKSNEEKQR